MRLRRWPPRIFRIARRTAGRRTAPAPSCGAFRCKSRKLCVLGWGNWPRNGCTVLRPAFGGGASCSWPGRCGVWIPLPCRRRGRPGPWPSRIWRGRPRGAFHRMSPQRLLSGGSGCFPHLGQRPWATRSSSKPAAVLPSILPRSLGVPPLLSGGAEPGVAGAPGCTALLATRLAHAEPGRRRNFPAPRAQIPGSSFGHASPETFPASLTSYFRIPVRHLALLSMIGGQAEDARPTKGRPGVRRGAPFSAAGAGRKGPWKGRPRSARHPWCAGPCRR